MKYTKDEVKYILENFLFNQKINFDYNHKQLGNQSLARKLYKYFSNIYKNLFRNGAEIIYCYKNKDNIINLLDSMFCYCGNKNRFHNIHTGYNKYCSSKCAANDKTLINKRINKMREIDETGLSGYDKMALKAINSAKNNIDENGMNSLQRAVISRKRTNLEKHGDENWNNREKCKNTKLIIHCDENWNNKIQAIQTTFIRYGKENYSQTTEYRNKYNNILFLFKRELNRAFTCYVKYHKVYYLETEDCKKKSLLSKNSNSKNKTSKPEDEGYLKLLTKFPDALHHYTVDPRYPFECDYYIPSLDLFIECHYFWTHGDPKYNCHEPFDKNSSKHAEMLQRWKDKNTKFYDNAIKVWTYYDPLKLKTFKDNHLKYKIFYTEKEFNDWFDKIII